MLGLRSEPREDLAHWNRDNSERQAALSGLLIAGAVILGLGFLTWTYLGPDLRRYMKIHSM